MTMCNRIQKLAAAAVMGCFASGIAAAQTAPYPTLVTAQTRANSKALAGLERPGKIVFSDGFESAESVKKYFEIRGLREGRAKLVTDAGVAHSGSGAIQFTAVARDGRESGSGASGWLGAEGYERLYSRRYIKFAADYDQEHMIQVSETAWSAAQMLESETTAKKNEALARNQLEIVLGFVMELLCVTKDIWSTDTAITIILLMQGVAAATHEPRSPPAKHLPTAKGRNSGKR